MQVAESWCTGGVNVAAASGCWICFEDGARWLRVGERCCERWEAIACDGTGICCDWMRSATANFSASDTAAERGVI